LQIFYCWVIFSLLSLPNQGVPEQAELSSQQRRERTIEALLGQVTRLAQRRPVLAVFEDLHWADASTHDLLDR
jgi:predicted ATPase